MEITTDLSKIQKTARIRDDDDMKFRTFLKGHPLSREEIDTIVHDVYEEVASQIDCTQCANCCIKLNTFLEVNDIVKLAQGLKMPVAEFKERFLVPAPEAPYQLIFNALPCPFLRNKRCTHYDYRPEECRSYPHLHKEDFVGRLLGVIENYAICPIVFNVYEQLKGDLWHTGG